MADPKYWLSKVWDCTSTELNANGAPQLVPLGGGWTTSNDVQTPAWGFELGPGATISDIGHGTGVVGGLFSTNMNIFGAHYGTATAPLSTIRQFRCGSGVLEFYITLAALPLENTYLLDMQWHNDPTYWPAEGYSLLDSVVVSPTGEIGIDPNGGGIRWTGWFLSVGVETHCFYQVEAFYYGVNDVTFGIGGNAIGVGTQFWPVQNFSIGRCARGATDGHGSHALNATIRHIRYTHLVTRYPSLELTITGTYTPDAAPFDYAAPATITATLTGDDYLGPPVIRDPANADPSKSVVWTFGVTDVSGGTGPYTYKWFEWYRGTRTNDALYTLDQPTATIKMDDMDWRYASLWYCVVTDANGVVRAFGPKSTQISSTTLLDYAPGIHPDIVVWLPDLYKELGAAPFSFSGQKIFGNGNIWDTFGSLDPDDSTFRVDPAPGYPDEPMDIAYFPGINKWVNLVPVTSGMYGSKISIWWPGANTGEGTSTLYPVDPWDSTDAGWWKQHVRTREWLSPYDL